MRVGAVLVRAGIVTREDFTYSDTPDTSTVQVDVLLNPGTDYSFLSEIYRRQIAIEDAIASLKATTIEEGPEPAPPVTGRAYSLAYGESYS